MSVNTILLDFAVDPSTVKNESQISTVLSSIENVLREYLTNLKKLTTVALEADRLFLYSSDGSATTNIRVSNTGLITLNIEFLIGEAQEPLLNFEVISSRNSSNKCCVVCQPCKCSFTAFETFRAEIKSRFKFLSI